MQSTKTSIAAAAIAGREERQVDDAQHLCRPRAEAARGHVEMRADLGEAGLDAAGRNGEEAEHISEDQRRARAGEEQAGGDAEGGAHGGVDVIVERGERHEQADREHGAGHGVADRGEPHERPARRGLRDSRTE